MWLRLARPYAGDTYGLHMPLLAGTEVAVAFEQGDPDRPFIAHALHTNLEPDHVTIHNHKRNVLRTPTNNKIRLDDTRGQEHIKVSTEYSGKSQLNLGHLVDAKKQKRGEGFELRTDGWGAVRAGKGVFISADVQPGAQGQVLAMQEAVARLKQAGDEIRKLSADAETAKADPADVQAQLTLLSERLDKLQASVALISAPQGIAVTSGHHLQLAAERNLMLNAGNEADISVVRRLFIGVGEGLSLFVRKLGMKLIANQGAVQIQAQNDRMEILARMGLDIVSSEDEIHITAKKKILLNAAGTYIALDQHGIESGTEGDYLIKSAQFDHQGPASMPATHPEYPKLESAQRLRLRIPQTPNSPPQVNQPSSQTDIRKLYASLFKDAESADQADGTSTGPGEDGPGKWVTQETDYHGIQNTGQMFLNRLFSLGDEGRLFGSEGKDYENTQRTLIQEWVPLSAEEEHLRVRSVVRRYGEVRRIKQTFLEGPDSRQVSGKSWHWQPVTANTVYEFEGMPL